MKISRKQAESLIESAGVLSTCVEHHNAEIQIKIKLANLQQFTVKYDRQSHTKTYDLDDASR